MDDDDESVVILFKSQSFRCFESAHLAPALASSGKCLQFTSIDTAQTAFRVVSARYLRYDLSVLAEQLMGRIGQPQALSHQLRCKFDG